MLLFVSLFLSTISNVEFDTSVDGSTHDGDLETQMTPEEDITVPETAGTESEVSGWPQRPNKKKETQKVQTHKLMKSLLIF